MELIKAMRGEDLDGGDPAKVAPMVAVRCPTYAGVIIAKDFASKKARAVGEDDVVLSETFFGGGWGGHQ